MNLEKQLRLKKHRSKTRRPRSLFGLRTWLKSTASILLLTFSCNSASANGETESASPPVDAKIEDLNTSLMLSTFKIVGQSRPKYLDLTGIVTGTAFVLEKADLELRSRGSRRLFLVTAAHILSELGGDTFYLIFRIPEGEGWKELPIPVTISKFQKPSYTLHPNVDVGVLDLLKNVEPKYHQQIISNVKAILLDEIADENRLRKLELHPGDDLSCLGFPLSIETDGGFPILRGGKIASYPILPTKIYQKFLLDFEVYRGNSGGPVYISNSSRVTSDEIQLGPVTGVVGILSGEQLLQGEPIKMGVVIPSTYILDTIKLMN